MASIKQMLHKITTRHLFTLATCVCVSSIMQGVIVPKVDLSELIANSDVVAVCSVDDITRIGTEAIAVQGRSIEAMKELAHVRLFYIIKGEAQGDSLTVAFDVPGAFTGYGDIAEHKDYIMFLSQHEDGLHFTNSYFPVLPALGDISLKNATTNNSLTEIDKDIVNQEEAVVRANKFDESEKLSAVLALGDIQSPESTRALSEAANNGHDAIRVMAVSQLLLRNDIAVLPIAVDMLEQFDQSTEGTVASNLDYGIRDGIRNPDAIPLLQRLADNGQAVTRIAALHAMRATGARSAIPALIRALEDPDKRARYEAVAGLAEITGQSDMHPSLIDFRDDEEKYVRYWKNWARVNEPSALKS